MQKSSEPHRITIIGTGLIGASIGLALKAAALVGVEIVGHDRERGAASQAERMGAIDRAEHSLPRAVAGARIVVVATPLLEIREVFGQIAPDLAPGAVVTDTASTKAHIMAWAREMLPESVSFVGGHPMAGKETAGVENAEATLFQGRAYCICPAVNATEGAVKSILGLVQLIGAEPLFIDAEEHDQYAAAVSHLPLMISTVLFHMLRSSPSWPDMGLMASSGFRDVTRLASGDPALSHGIWLTNREAVIHWLDRMTAEIVKFRDMLQDAKDEALLEIFTKAQIDRDAFMREPPRRERLEQVPKVDSRKALLDMLVGGMIAEQIRKAQTLPEVLKERPRTGEKTEGGRPSLAERIAEDIRRDIEKMDKDSPHKDEG